ncbi:related to Transcription initiation factor IIF subunit beta [Saccharomycodes ludwigii]|uniref:Transcription initiation factor IIF subunit beta n=1 Tax=Saccharomycodes ludwigii TaxID=36035 RepID=A0A376B3T7_9ASCO|nr:related to Transcription initiation factor IIF subunit beta [Saccharomycodes ludwigii]
MSSERKDGSVTVPASNSNDSGDEYLSQDDEVFDGNDIENNETKIYEESLDLDLGSSAKQVWLVRLPMFLAKKWRDRDNLKGQELGKIRINKKDQTIRMVLDDTGDENLPRNYDIELTKKVVENEFVFTEQNLKKYEKKAKELENNPEMQKQLFIKRQERQEEIEKKKKRQQQQYKRNKKKFFRRVVVDREGRDRYIPYVKTIPKKTALVGTICHECQVIPSIDDPNYHNIVEQRRQLVRNVMKPTITVLEETVGVTMSNAGMSMRTDNSNFLKVGREKQQKNSSRAIRMPKKELLDLLFKLFDEYDYWSLKGLKERTKQPEVYLKECLDQVAMLVKKGPYALKYTLKTEYKKLKQAERDLTLGELAKSGEGGSDNENLAKDGNSAVTQDDGVNNQNKEKVVPGDTSAADSVTIKKEDENSKVNGSANVGYGKSTSNNGNEDDDDDEDDEDIELEDVV